MALGTLMFAGLEGAKNVGGTRGRPKEVVALGAGEFEVLCVLGRGLSIGFHAAGL